MGGDLEVHVERKMLHTVSILMTFSKGPERGARKLTVAHTRETDGQVRLVLCTIRYGQLGLTANNKINPPNFSMVFLTASLSPFDFHTSAWAGIHMLPILFDNSSAD